MAPRSTTAFVGQPINRGTTPIQVYCTEHFLLRKKAKSYEQINAMKLLFSLSLVVAVLSGGGGGSRSSTTAAAFAFTPSSSRTTAATTAAGLAPPFGYSSSSALNAALLEAPVREPETKDRVQEVRERFRKASEDAAQAKGCAADEAGMNEWWRKPLPDMYRSTDDEPLRVVIAGGGVAGLVAAAACHAKGMKVAIFEQASQYAPYGGPIQIQSNALRYVPRTASS